MNDNLSSDKEPIQDTIEKGRFTLLKEKISALKDSKRVSPLFLISFIFISLIFTLILVQRAQIYKSRASGANSSIDLAISADNSHKATLEEIFEVPVMVNTDDTEIIGADIVVTFDKNYLELNDIIPKAEGTPITKFLPVDSNGSFDKGGQIQNANISGVIDFSALSYSGNQTPTGFTGILGPTNPLAIFRFRALKEGSTTINVSSNNSTNDSNLLTRTPQDILGKTTNFNINVSQATPPPQGTETLTLTTIDDGYSINGFGHNEKSAILRMGGSKYDSGFRFTWPLTPKAEIISAKLKVYSERVSVPTTVVIKTEQSLNSLPFSGKNQFIANRTYFQNGINWNITGDNNEVTSPDIKSLIADIVNQTGWTSNKNITLSLLHGSGLSYANIISKEGVEDKTAKLVIEYRLPPSPTPTPSPSPSPIAPPTPNVTINTSCVNGTYTDNEVTISWTNNTTPVSWVDISTDPNFSSWYHKSVQTNAGAASNTTAPMGFTDLQTSTQPLVANSNTTYYVRTWNGVYSQRSASFNINSCPTSSSEPLGDRESISVTTIDDGYSINGFGHEEGNSRLRAGNNYDAGFRFALPVPAKSQIISATLTSYADYTNDTALSIKAEQNLNAPALSGSNIFIPNRTYFNNSVSWNLSNSGTISSPDLKGLIQNIVDQNGWQANNNILIALLHTNSQFAQLVSREGNSSQATILTVIFRKPQPVERTITTIDDGYSINNFGHNETNTLLRVGSSNYDAGFRFALPVPANAQILEAKLTIYAQGSGSSLVNIKAENSLNADALIGFNPYIPNRVFFDNSVSWNISSNGNITSPDLKSLIQSIVNQNSWQANNNILIALLKANSNYINIASKESDNSKAAKLFVKYQ